MKTLSPHFFMEVIIKKLHNNVDKFATLNHAGDVIHYTEKSHPTLKRVINLAEGKRVFEDLHGTTDTRWEVTPEYHTLEARKAKAAKRRLNKAASFKRGVA